MLMWGFGGAQAYYSRPDVPALTDWVVVRALVQPASSSMHDDDDYDDNDDNDDSVYSPPLGTPMWDSPRPLLS